MKKNLFLCLIIPGLFICFSCSRQPDQEEKLILKENWAIQSSAKVNADGARISTLEYKPEGWIPTSVPSTVLAALVKNGVYPDPYFGTNIEKIPGNITG